MSGGCGDPLPRVPWLHPCNLKADLGQISLQSRDDPPMTRNLIAQCNDPSTAARYLGESVGTHYSSALRATEAYGKYLAAKRESLLSEIFEGEGLGDFWRDLLRSEQIRIGSPKVLKGLSTTPSHYLFDFLDTADDVYRRSYGDVPSSLRKKLGQTEHAQCLRFLRNHAGGGVGDQFTVRNKIATWMKLLRIMGGYQE